jgi:hypothetical protein
LEKASTSLNCKDLLCITYDHEDELKEGGKNQVYSLLEIFKRSFRVFLAAPRTLKLLSFNNSSRMSFGVLGFLATPALAKEPASLYHLLTLQ